MQRQLQTYKCGQVQRLGKLHCYSPWATACGRQAAQLPLRQRLARQAGAARATHSAAQTEVNVVLAQALRHS